MRLRRILARLSIGMVLAVAALAMSAPPVTRAATTIVIDDVSPADNCGKYDDDEAETNASMAITDAPAGSTVVVCPGTYYLSGPVSISGKKLTIKRALTDPGQMPVFVVDTGFSMAFYIYESSGVTIDGLVIDGKPSTQTGYAGVRATRSELTLKNVTILGPDQADSKGVYVDNTTLTRALSVSISNSYINGYQGSGVYATGAAKLTVKSCHLDTSDGGRVSGTTAEGVYFDGQLDDLTAPTGSVSKSTLMNNNMGVRIEEASKVSVSSSTLIGSRYGVYIKVVNGYHNADNNKVTGNTIMGIPSNGFGVHIDNGSPDTFTIKGLNISKNQFYAGQYTGSGGYPRGVYMIADPSVEKMISGTISGNTFWGFTATPSPAYIVNEDDRAEMKISKNTVLP